MKTDCIEAFDLDLTLKDASTDPIIRPTRRMIAAACIGMGPEDAYYSVRELREAIEWIHEGESSGKRKLTQILGNQCDDFQRCIYYALAGKGIVLILDDLLWLEGVLEARGRFAGELFRMKRPTMPLVSPYVAAEPDGPVGRFDTGFEIGASWSFDPGPGYDAVDHVIDPKLSH
ncbi:hypothetical protein ACU5AX_19635 [Sphingomonas sp. XXL09]|uniref:hypothetical protein n=1 Tax=Sphingomonas sp. XXL09 TaxID=3457787 RepID=UPI00406BAF3E